MLHIGLGQTDILQQPVVHGPQGMAVADPAVPAQGDIHRGEQAGIDAPQDVLDVADDVPPLPEGRTLEPA